MPDYKDLFENVPENLSDLGVVMEGKLARDDNGNWVIIDDKGYKYSVRQALLKFEGHHARIVVADILRVKEATNELAREINLKKDSLEKSKIITLDSSKTS